MNAARWPKRKRKVMGSILACMTFKLAELMDWRSFYQSFLAVFLSAASRYWIVSPHHAIAILPVHIIVISRRYLQLWAVYKRDRRATWLSYTNAVSSSLQSTQPAETYHHS